MRGTAGAADTITSRKVKIANFDEDLATVYVNGVAATNGTVITVPDGASVTLELGDFQNDWYFAYAPDSQTDRSLALEHWDGLPAGASTNLNPCTFTPSAYLTTVAPNVDCKGHVWHAIDSTAMSNSVCQLAASSFNATTRTVSA